MKTWPQKGKQQLYCCYLYHVQVLDAADDRELLLSYRKVERFTVVEKKRNFSCSEQKANIAAKKQYRQAQGTEASKQPDLPNLRCICALKAFSPFKCSFWYHVSETHAHPFEPDFLPPLGLCGYSPASSEHIAVCRWKKQMFSREHFPRTTTPKPPSTLYLK